VSATGCRVGTDTASGFFSELTFASSHVPIYIASRMADHVVQTSCSKAHGHNNIEVVGAYADALLTSKSQPSITNRRHSFCSWQLNITQIISIFKLRNIQMFNWSHTAGEATKAVFVELQHFS
jgi:hypothetical protein